jgi:4-amino-4-deoxy-L-arabinose transferase-like glycosyltransferase
MFMDGTLYACVAKNLANGLGTFWYPYFSETTMSFFHEQPPLTFGILSLFYKLFGNSIYTERGYCFLTACISAYLIYLIWKEIFLNDKPLKNTFWLPILFWIITPVCFWSYTNNTEENTMGCFDLLAVFMTIIFFNRSFSIVYLIFAGVAIFLASLSKGFPGLFPISIPLFYWLITKNFSIKKTLTYILILLSVPAIIYAFLTFDGDIRNSLETYINERVFNSINNVSTVDNRLSLIYRLFMELLPAIGITIILLIIFRLKSLTIKEDFKTHKAALLLFLFIGISASIPLIITKEQRGFYLVTSLPYYAIAISIITAPILSRIIEKINLKHVTFKIFKIVTYVILLFSITFSVSKIGGTIRDKDKLHDIYIFGKIIPPGSIVGINPSMWEDWSLQTYMVRHFNISLIGENRKDKKYKYLILDNQVDNIGGGGNDNYKRIDIQTCKYNLYLKR